MKTELEEFINENRDAFFRREPDASVLLKIQEKMREAETKKKQPVPVISLRLRWAAAACLLLTAGAVGYLALQRTESNSVAVVTVPKTTTTPQVPPTTPSNTPAQEQASESVITQEPKQEIQTVRYNTSAQPIDQYRTALFAQLNNEESASQRLEAAAQVERITNTDTDIVDALTKTMNNDPNTNVRMAALDALSKFYREPYVKKQLLASLSKQKDPMVQIALIELLTKMKEVSILKQLNKMVSDERTIQPVKDQAYTGILTLRS